MEEQNMCYSFWQEKGSWIRYFSREDVKLGLNRAVKELYACKNVSIAGKVKVVNKDLIDRAKWHRYMLLSMSVPL